MTSTTTLVPLLHERCLLPPPPICKAARLAAGATQDELATVVGVDRATISRYEDGTREPHGDHRRRYSRAIADLFMVVADHASEGGWSLRTDRQRGAAGQVDDWVRRSTFQGYR